MILKGKRIFLVEDNLGNAAIIQMLVEQDGAKLFRGRWGGNETLELLERYFPVDIILMDLMLPKQITGYDVFSRIRQLPKANSIPILAVSASEAAVAIPKARAMGFAGFIAKPLNFMKFAKQIASVIEGNTLWDANRYLEIDEND